MKENKEKTPFMRVLKQYAPLIVIIVCVIAITAVLLFTGINNNEQTKLPDQPVTPVENPDDSKKEEDELDKYAKNPDDEPVVTPVKTWVLPVKDYKIGMDYSETEFTYSDTLKEWLIHKGIDFIVSEGSEVYAVSDGTVESVTTTIMEGTTVVIVHDDGVRSVYSSLKAEPLVKINQRVKASTVIGYASDSGYGEFLQGAHVHFEMTLNKVSVNPRDYIKGI